MIRTLYRHRSGAIVPDLPDEQLSAAIQDAQAALWLDITDTNPEELHQVLGNLFHFHPLAIEDTIADSHIPKVDNYGSYLFLVFHTVHQGQESVDFQTFEVDTFLGPNFLITIHREPMSNIDRLRDPSLHETYGLARGPAMLLYELLDRQVDTYTPLIEQFERRLESLGDLIFTQNMSQRVERELMDDILTAKSSSLRLRRILIPQRDLITKLSRDDYGVIPAQSRIYYRDVYDHMLRIADLAESMRDLATSTMDTYLALVNNRMNEIMKVLTVMSTIFIPLSFLAGVYGMNFNTMPELQQPWAYPLLWMLFLSIAGGLLLFFRRRGWV